MSSLSPNHRLGVFAMSSVCLLTAFLAGAQGARADDYVVINWLGEHPVLSQNSHNFEPGFYTSQIQALGSRRAIVLADAITLNTEAYLRNLNYGPEEVIILADTVYLTGAFYFNMNAFID